MVSTLYLLNQLPGVDIWILPLFKAEGKFSYPKESKKLASTREHKSESSPVAPSHASDVPSPSTTVSAASELQVPKNLIITAESDISALSTTSSGTERDDVRRADLQDGQVHDLAPNTTFYYNSTNGSNQSLIYSPLNGHDSTSSVYSCQSDSSESVLSSDNGTLLEKHDKSATATTSQKNPFKWKINKNSPILEFLPLEGSAESKNKKTNRGKSFLNNLKGKFRGKKSGDLADSRASKMCEETLPGSDDEVNLIDDNSSNKSFSSAHKTKIFSGETYVKLCSVKRNIQLPHHHNVYLSCYIFFTPRGSLYPIFIDTQKSRLQPQLPKAEPRPWNIFEWMQYFEDLSEVDSRNPPSKSDTNYPMPSVPSLHELEEIAVSKNPPPDETFAKSQDVQRPNKPSDNNNVKLSSKQKSSNYRSSIEHGFAHHVYDRSPLCTNSFGTDASSPVSSSSSGPSLLPESLLMVEALQDLPLVLRLKLKLKGTRNILGNKLYYTLNCINGSHMLAEGPKDWIHSISNNFVFTSEASVMPRRFSVALTVKGNVDEDFFIKFNPINEGQQPASLKPSTTKETAEEFDVSKSSKASDAVVKEAAIVTSSPAKAVTSPGLFEIFDMTVLKSGNFKSKDSDYYFATVNYISSHLKRHQNGPSYELWNNDVLETQDMLQRVLAKMLTISPKIALIRKVFMELKQSLEGFNASTINLDDGHKVLIDSFDAISSMHIILHLQYNALKSELFCMDSAVEEIHEKDGKHNQQQHENK